MWDNPLSLEVNASLPTVIEEAGVRPDEVDQVIFTHLHWDHTGWNTIEENGAYKLTFPNARYVVQQKEYDFWTSGGDLPSNGPAYDRVIAPLESAGAMDLVGGEHAVTSEVLTIPMPGHTPGHVAFGISSGGEHAYIVGDGAHKPVQITEPDWYPGFDLDPVESTKNRHAIFDRAEGENAIIAAGHFAFPSMGRAKQVNGKRVFEYIS
jgi:glyoxylase-like metal-dependent hydrolase (beta-lactamase superfamily II)